LIGTLSTSFVEKKNLNSPIASHEGLITGRTPRTKFSLAGSAVFPNIPGVVGLYFLFLGRQLVSVLPHLVGFEFWSRGFFCHRYFPYDVE
jgi:hypothetical protein